MSTQQPAVRGGWLEASRQPMLDAALAGIPADATMEMKVAAMEDLAAKLATLVEWDRFDPKTMTSVVLKRNYREVERIDLGIEMNAMQVLPDGRIVSGHSNKTIRIWIKGSDGAWSSEELRGHIGSLYCLQVLPDGRIVSGSSDRTIRIWTKGADGAWSNEELGGHTLAI